MHSSAHPCTHFSASPPHRAGSVFRLPTLQLHSFLDSFGNADVIALYIGLVFSFVLKDNTLLAQIDCSAPFGLCTGQYVLPGDFNGIKGKEWRGQAQQNVNVYAPGIVEVKNDQSSSLKDQKNVLLKCHLGVLCEQILGLG